MCIALGPVSGGHFNPAVTIGFWATRRMGTFDALAYCLAQLAGAAAAAYLLRWVMPEEIWRAAALGTPDLANGLTRMPGMLIEASLAFLLTLVVYAGSVHEGMVPHPAVGVAAAFMVTAGVLIGGPFTGGAMNPARVFGPALASRHWDNHGVYWVGPLVGGVLGAWLYNLCCVRVTAHPD
jgi:MIP family channel proteins